MGVGNLYFATYHMLVLFLVYIWVTAYGTGQSRSAGNVGANCFHLGRRVWVSGADDSGDGRWHWVGVGGICINKQMMCYANKTRSVRGKE